MIEQGAVEEVEALLARKLDPNLPVMRAIGVREIAAYLRGEIDARRGDRRRPAGDPPLRQAPIYLVRAPAAARNGRASPSRSTATASADALALLRAERLGGAPWSCCATPTSTPRRSPASASRSSATATRAARRRSTSTTAAIDVVVGLRGGSASATEAEAAGLEVALVEDAVGVGRRRHAARARRDPRRALPRDRAAPARRRRARLQPRAVGPLRLRRAARRPRRLPGRAQGPGHRAALALPARARA